MNPKDNAKLNEETGCLEWQGKLWNHGYGHYPHHKLAHRISYAMNIGPIPKGLCVLHRCDNKKCVNPDHLWLGTYRDNNRDKEAKGRGNHFGHPSSEKVKDVWKKIGLANTGKKHSEQSRKNMGLSHIGKKRGGYQKHKIWTVEEKLAISQRVKAMRTGTKLIDGHYVKIKN